MEMLVAISILAMFSSIALPSIDSFYHEETINTSAAELASDVRLARAWALENQTYVRIVFNPDGYSSWVVQELTDSLGESISGEPSVVMTSAEMNDYSEYPTYWRSIIDSGFRELDSAKVELKFTPAVPAPVFFRPDGLLVSSPNSSASIFGTLKVRFFYEDLEGVEVDITPSGAIESVAYYNEDF